jgi:putative ABC transport system ATP-binding protein
MESNLFKYIWRHSRAEQLRILLVVLASMPFYFLSLDLPKDIVNKGIQGQAFSGPGSTQPFLDFDLPFGDLLTGNPVPLYGGFLLEQSELLIALSLTFLALVVVNGLFKLWINTAKGRLGERMLRRLRYELTDRVLRFPLMHIRRMKQAEVATMIKDEVEPLGGFIGDAFITPVFLGGQALTALIFILVQSIWLGLVALAIVLLQAWIIPRLRRRILVLGKERQLTARQLAGRIGELMDGAVDVHANDTSNYERADVVSRLGRIFHIRFEIYQRKFFVKFLNNFLSQLTPFIFYLLGGLLALSGQLDIGALVAVIAAYKDLPGPIKEMIDWDQQRLDVQIKYTQVIEQFEPGEILPPEAQAVVTDTVPPLDGELAASSVTLIEDDGSKRLEGISFTLPLAQHLAIVGDSASGKERLALIVAGLERPTAGSVTIGGRDIEDLPESVTGRRLGYVGPDAYHFPQSVRDNLLYGLKHAPLRPPKEVEAERQRRRHEEHETRRADNPLLPVEYDWVDRVPLGGEDEESEARALLAIVRLVELEEDIYRFGLYGSLDPERDPAMAEALLLARARFWERLQQEGEHDLVARIDPEVYLRHATVAENLLFGTPTKREFDSINLGHQAAIRGILQESELEADLMRVGLSIARTMVELFADLPPGHPFFEQFSFIDAVELPEFKALIARADRGGIEALSAAEQGHLLRLSFDYIEERHRLALVTDAFEEKVLRARRKLAEAIAEGRISGIEPFDPERYNAAASILANILFGKLVYGQADAEAVVSRLVTEVLQELDLKERVVAVGFQFNVGIAGKRLSSTQRQKLALARALIKDPDLLVVNDALAVADGSTQTRIIASVREHRAKRGIVWCLTRASSAKGFDRVILLEYGRKVGEGSFEDLAGEGSALARLVAAG